MGCSGKGKGGGKRNLAVLVGAVVLAGCGFFTSKPDTPEQQVTLDVIENTMRGVCVVVAREEPEAAIQLQTVLRTQVIPVVRVRSAMGIAEKQRGFAVDDIKALIAQWDRYLGVGLAMVKALAQSEGWLDTSSTYWGAVNRVFVGCLAGLDAVLVLPTPVADPNAP